MKASLAVVLIVAVLTVAGCVNLGSGQKAATGSMVGGIAGGLLSDGSLGGMIGGMLVGSLLGSAIGDYLDQRDKEIALKSAQQSLERSRSGVTSSWQNPDTGNSGSFTPTGTYQAPGGRYCRAYTASIRLEGGQAEDASGTACRRHDGSWEVVS